MSVRNASQGKVSLSGSDYPSRFKALFEPLSPRKKEPKKSSGSKDEPIHSHGKSKDPERRSDNNDEVHKAVTPSIMVNGLPLADSEESQIDIVPVYIQCPPRTDGVRRSPVQEFFAERWKNIQKRKPRDTIGPFAPELAHVLNSIVRNEVN